MAYKAVLFDWGGVLGSFKGLELQCAGHFGVTVQQYEAAELKHERRFYLGMPEGEWEQLMAGELGVPAPNEPGFRKSLEAVYKRNDVMLEKAKLLKQHGIKIAVVSNTKIPAKLFFEEDIIKSGYDIFDAYVFSCNKWIRAVKPESHIYLMAAKWLGVAPQECIFLDDKMENVDGASAIGMKGVRHSSNENTIRELSDILQLSL